MSGKQPSTNHFLTVQRLYRTDLDWINQSVFSFLFFIIFFTQPTGPIQLLFPTLFCTFSMVHYSWRSTLSFGTSNTIANDIENWFCTYTTAAARCGPNNLDLCFTRCCGRYNSTECRSSGFLCMHRWCVVHSNVHRLWMFWYINAVDATTIAQKDHHLYIWHDLITDYSSFSKLTKEMMKDGMQLTPSISYPYPLFANESRQWFWEIAMMFNLFI